MDPEVPPPKSKEEVQRELKEWIEKNSKPKEILQPPKVDRGKKFNVGANSEKLKTWSKPKYKYVKPCNNPVSWEYKLKHLVKQSALNYTPTARITELAVPLPRNVYVKPKETPLVKSSAKNYVASEKINELALPKYPRKKWRKRKCRYVKQSALKGKTPEKLSIDRLAQPVIKPITCCRENPFGISEAAKKAQASKRIRGLAVPALAIKQLKGRHKKCNTAIEYKNK